MIKLLFSKTVLMLSLCVSGAIVILPAYAMDDELSGAEIVKRCGSKHPGEDQRSTFTVLLKDEQGNEKRSVYARLWKDYKGVDGIVDKMVLFTEFPPDAKGAAFMRWSFTRDMNKNADQWIYLPVLGKTRRVTIRDPGDSFLNSDLTHADVSPRAIDEDDHNFIGVKEADGNEFYVVESTPKEGNPLYKKRISWFSKTPEWENCVNVRIDYYDTRGDLLKEQFIKWQHIDNAWVWSRVMVRNLQTAHVSIFEVSDVSIDTGLKDRLFTERSLRIGPSVIPKLKK